VSERRGSPIQSWPSPMRYLSRHGGMKSGLFIYFFLAEGLGEAAAACFGWNASFLAAAHFCC
jgi:hypothetical protein